MDHAAALAQMRAYFQMGATRPLAARLSSLRALRDAILREESALLAALSADLGKSAAEGYMTEIGQVLQELRFHIRHLQNWSRPKRVPTALAQLPGRSVLLREPYGVALILSPWNYPLNLSLTPLVGALSAGNCAVIKPSPDAPATALALEHLISSCLPSQHVMVVQGSEETSQALLRQRFDYIFFTGSPGTGRLVMQAAAQHLTPLTLELGGKSPCIVTASANLPLAARRILFGKLLNAGQTCVAPDYVLVERGAKPRLVECLKQELDRYPGPSPLESEDYPRIINSRHYNRLTALLEGATILAGGQGDGTRLAPTLADEPPPSHPLMQEEIFGPILPIVSYETLRDAVDFVARRPHALSLYLFTGQEEEEAQVVQGLSFGGCCINDTVLHLSSPHLPFGGVGDSGTGRYHGKASFDTFSYEKSVLKKACWPDFSFRYPPFTPQKLRLLRRFLR